MLDNAYHPEEQVPPADADEDQLSSNGRFGYVPGESLCELHEYMAARKAEWLSGQGAEDIDPSVGIEKFRNDLIIFFDLVVRRHEVIQAALETGSKEALMVALSDQTPVLHPDSLDVPTLFGGVPQDGVHAAIYIRDARATLKLRREGKTSPPYN